ncbi:MAG: DUF3302 domain-containing protein [Rhodobacteraceae bacterium]|nr:DUF3302 domain-containing protein [Paracoccaceae bacterium]
MGLLGRPLTNYDYMTFVALILLMAAVMALVLFLMGLPGRIALKRNHPHAEAVKIMGYMGFLVVVPWVHAFMWAFHDAVTVDVRRFPDEERDAIRKEIERLGGVVKAEYQSPEVSETPPDKT